MKNFLLQRLHWKVKLTNDPEHKSWVFKTQKEAELFIEDRYNLTNHLGYNPDDTYHIYTTLEKP